MKNLLYFFQKPNQTNSDYHEDFLAMVEVIEEYGEAGSLTHFPNMLKTEVTAAKNANGNMGKATEEEVVTAKKIVKEKFLAALMLSGANRERYGELKRGMAENYMTGTSEYPESPEVVLCILNAYAREETRVQCLPNRMILIGKRASSATTVAKRGILPGSASRKETETSPRARTPARTSRCMQTWKSRTRKTRTKTFLSNRRNQAKEW